MQKTHRYWRLICKCMRPGLLPLLLIAGFAGISYANPADAQDVLDKEISLSVGRMEIRSILNQISKKADVKFVYSSQKIPVHQLATCDVENEKLGSVLGKLFLAYNVRYESKGNKIILTKMKEVADSSGLQMQFVAAYTAKLPKPITGKVSDENGQPLAGVSVKVKGTTMGTSTNSNGEFTLDVPETATLVISYVGYDTKEIKLQKQDAVSVSLLPAASNKLNEVVVVGTQVQNRRKTITSLASVSSKQIENLPSASVDVLLQGRISGMNVQVYSGEPGVAPSMTIRGNTKVNTDIGSNEYVSQAQSMSGPLYIIDGMPVNVDDISNTLSSTGTSYLAGININDIESVEVQKDAAATAAWGSRGANGIVYIKTKRGRSKTPEFRLNVYGGFVQRPELIKTYTGAEERRLKMNILGQYATPTQMATLPQILLDSLNPAFNNATDWQGLFYRNGSIKNGDLTISAAGDVVNYRLSMNYYNEDGIVKGTGYQRYSIRGNFDFRINSKLNSQLILGFSKGDRQKGRKFNLYDDNTPFAGSNQPGSFYRLTSFDSLNFTGLYDKLRNKNINDNYNISFTTNYTILPSLRYTFQGSVNASSSARDYFAPSNLDEIAVSNGGASQPSFASSNKSNFDTYFLSNTLNYFKKFAAKGDNQHNIAFTVSQQYTANVSKTANVQGYNVPSNDIQVVSGIPQADLSGYSTYAKDALLSVGGQLQYDYNNRYLIYGSYRGDASSRFGKNTKWGYFPAIGAGWIVSDEKFMDKLSSVINFLKIRGSWGISGTQSPNFYAPFNVYDIAGTYGGSTAIQPNYNNGLTKNNLTWTKTEQKSIGIDAYFLNSRINVSADIYDKISKDDYFRFTLPFYTGFNSIEFNAKDLWVSNRGLDLTISTKNLSSRSPLQWNSQLVLSFNKNAIAKLPGNNRTFVIDDYYGIARVFAVGQPIYTMFQMLYGGVYNTVDEIPFNPVTGNRITYFKGNYPVQPGYPIWKDVNGDYDVWSDEDNGDRYGDRVPTGNPNPKFTGGFTNDFTYRNFTLSVVSIFTWKRDVVNTFMQQQFDAIASSQQNFAKRRLPDLTGINYWTPDNAKADGNKANFPAINPFAPYFYQFFPFSDMWNVDGSYFKVKYVTLSYEIPRSVFGKLGMKSARVYGMMDNVLIVKNKNNTMPDPESVNQLGVYTGGLFPQPRKFTFGIDVQF
jgi:TonB-linked SusC/RagA family outer membrane protein